MINLLNSINLVVPGVMKLKISFVLFFLLIGCGSVQTEGETELINEIDAVQLEIFKMAENKECNESSDCQFMSIGEQSCTLDRIPIVYSSLFVDSNFMADLRNKREELVRELGLLQNGQLKGCDRNCLHFKKGCSEGMCFGFYTNEVTDDIENEGLNCF